MRAVGSVAGVYTQLLRGVPGLEGGNRRAALLPAGVVRADGSDARSAASGCSGSASPLACRAGGREPRSAPVPGFRSSTATSRGSDHDRRLAAAGVTAPFDERRATRTMAALTAMIDTSPAHCSASPMPSPQYGLEGPTSTGMT